MNAALHIYQPPEEHLHPSEIKSGDVLLFSGRSLWSRCIRRWTRSRWSHVGLAMWLAPPCGMARLCVVESLEGEGVRVVPFTSWLAWRGEIKRLTPPLDTELRCAALRFALHHWGCPYSSPLQFVRSFGAITTRVCRWLGLKKFDIEARRFFCSELVAGALHAAGCQLPKPPAAMTPADVADFLESGTPLRGVSSPRSGEPQ